MSRGSSPPPEIPCSMSSSLRNWIPTPGHCSGPTAQSEGRFILNFSNLMFFVISSQVNCPHPELSWELLHLLLSTPRINSTETLPVQIHSQLVLFSIMWEVVHKKLKEKFLSVFTGLRIMPSTLLSDFCTTNTSFAVLCLLNLTNLLNLLSRATAEVMLMLWSMRDFLTIAVHFFNVSCTIFFLSLNVNALVNKYFLSMKSKCVAAFKVGWLIF